MHETLVKCNKNAMNEHITLNQQHPTQQFHKNLLKPQIFSKTPKPRLKMHERMKNERIRTLTKCLRLDLD